MENFFASRNFIIWLILIVGVQVDAQTWQMESELNNGAKIEKIFNYTIGSGGIAFQVNSGGCTDKNNFRIETASDEGQTKLTLVRTTPDYCKARIPGGTLIIYSFEELNLDPNVQYKIENPVDPES